MKNIMKYLLAFMLAPAIALGMEPDREKVCRDEPLSKYLEDCLSQAQTSHALEINNLTGCVVSESLYSVEQCMRLANRMMALPLYTVKLINLMNDKTMPIEGLKAIADVLGTSPTLQRLELPNIWVYGLGQKRLCLIEDMIQRAPRLSVLDVSYYHLTGLPGHDLSSFLYALTQKRIDRLELGGHGLGYNKPVRRQVIDALRLMTHSLQSLGLRDNGLYRFSVADWHALGPVIGGLKELDLGDNNLGMRSEYFTSMSDDAWRALLDELTRSEIEKLNMRYNHLNRVNDAAWELFIHTIARMNNLKVLDLRWNSLKEIGYERFELLSSSLLCHDGMTVIIKKYDDPHHWWARLHGERGLNVVVK